MEVLGALGGFFVISLTNALRKLPMRRDPYKHALAIAIGYYAGHQVSQFWVNMNSRIDHMRTSNERKANKEASM